MSRPVRRARALAAEPADAPPRHREVGRRGLCGLALLAAVTAGCGQEPDRVAAPPAPQLAQVEWQLLEVTGADGPWPVQQLDSVLRFDGRGGWSATACNHLAGTAQHGDGWVEVVPGPTTAMACAGDGRRLEQAVGAVLSGRVAVELADGRLRLGPSDGTQLVYAERASISPTTPAREITAGERGQAQYRVALSGTGDALGLVLEARAAPGTPWGTSGLGGPQPGLEPGWWPYGEIEVAGRHLLAGFAPPGSARVSHRVAPRAPETGELEVQDIAGSPRTVWHGFVDTASTERQYTAHDADGTVLGTW